MASMAQSYGSVMAPQQVRYRKDINPDAGSSNPTSVVSLGNGKALFRASDGINGNELWMTDGTQ